MMLFPNIKGARIMDNTSRTETSNVKSYGYLLQDTALIIALLSALGYYLAFLFEKGYRDYYGIEAIGVTSIEISSIVNTVYKMFPIIAGIGAIYLFVRLLLWLTIPVIERVIEYIEVIVNSSLERIPNRLGFRNAIITISDYLIQYIVSRSRSIELYFPVITALLIPLYILGNNNASFALLIGLILVSIWLLSPLVILFRNRIITNAGLADQNLKNPIVFIWINSKWNTKIALLILFSIGVGYLFYQYGYTNAEKQEDYFIIEDTSETLLILDKNDNFMLVSLVNLKKPILESEYQLIPLQNDSTTSLNIKKITIEGGLQVVENSRTTQINNFINYIKNKLITN